MPIKVKTNPNIGRVEPGFRRTAICNEPRFELYQGSSYMLKLECRMNISLTINKTVFFRIKDEGSFKKDDWKIERLMKDAGIQPEEVVENSGEIETLWDERKLRGAELLALVYANPQSNYLEIFDFLPVNADEKLRTKLYNRFDTWYNKKFGQKTEEQDVPVEVVPGEETTDNQTTLGNNLGNPASEEDGVPF